MVANGDREGLTLYFLSEEPENQTGKAALTSSRDHSPRYRGGRGAMKSQIRIRGFPNPKGWRRRLM